MAGDFYVAIIGRPNVGKSTLFNRLTKERAAIVAKEAQTTRDRKIAEISFAGKKFFIIDTAGIVPKLAVNDLTKNTQKQVEIALKTADLILFMVDAKEGLNKEDEKIAKMLHRLPKNKKIILVANKAEGVATADFYDLGFGQPLLISALHNININSLLELIVQEVPSSQKTSQKEEKEIKVAIIGRPNVGKSALVNSLLGEERVIVSEIPGTTRDSIDVFLNFKGNKIHLVDTAGMVRKRKIEDKTVYFAILRTLEALKKSEIVILLLDAATGVVTFDKYLGGLLNDFLKGVVIAVNKWDLLTRGKVFRVEKAPLNKKEEELAMAYWLYYLQKELPHLSFAPVVFISALEKLNLNFLLEQILCVSENRPRLLSEEELLSLNENLHKQHSHLPLDLIVQQDLENPQIFLALSKAKITTSQKRFLSNFLIKNLNFPGWPLQIILGKPSRLRT